MKNLFKFSLPLLCAALTLTACQKEKGNNGNPESGPDQEFVVLTTSNELLVVNAANPGNSSMPLAITGLPAGETLLSIDFRPATGELYALGASSRLYIVNQTTGKSRAVGMTSFSPAIAGTDAEIDFNPTVDRVRLVTNTGQNLRLNPETGAVVAPDGAINGAPGATVEGIAYTNSVAGTTTTTLFDIDFKTGTLYRQDPPNAGGLVAIGNLGQTSDMSGGFDIAAGSNIAIAVATGTNASKVYIVNLMDGSSKARGAITATVRDIAISTLPVAYAVDAANALLIFNPEMPAGLVSRNITGLQAEEKVLGIDFRPLNGQLYALGSSNRLYTINLANGAAAVVGSPFSTSLQGMAFGFDFNPTVDRIRVVSDAGQNLRLNPNDGLVVATDGMLNPGTPMVSAAAYTNNFAGTTSTELLVIDHATGMLSLQSPPNVGTLVARGSVGMGFTSANGFDIGSRSNQGWAILTNAAGTQLVNVNLMNGSLSNAKAFPRSVTGFSIGTGF